MTNALDDIIRTEILEGFATGKFAVLLTTDGSILWVTV